MLTHQRCKIWVIMPNRVSFKPQRGVIWVNDGAQNQYYAPLGLEIPLDL
jgi:hypothetical protein